MRVAAHFETEYTKDLIVTKQQSSLNGSSCGAILVTYGTGFIGFDILDSMAGLSSIVDFHALSCAGNPENLRDVQHDPGYKSDSAFSWFGAHVNLFHPRILVGLALGMRFGQQLSTTAQENVLLHESEFA